MEASTVSLVVLLLATISTDRLSSAVKTAEKISLRYKLTEGQPTDTLVANIAGDARNLTDGGEVQYTVIKDSEPGPSLFRIDDDGLLRTRAVIDREALCPRQPACSVILNVVVEIGTDVKYVEIHVEVIDVNDNTPAFNESEVEFHLAESTPPGILFPLPVASDPDGPSYGVVGYRMSPESDMIGIQVENLSTGDMEVRLVLKGQLDRQQEGRYTFSLEAFDGGDPPRSGGVVVNIFVDDDSLRFDNASYTAVVPDNSPPGSIIIRLHASGAPGDTIVYSFSRRTQVRYGNLFAINSTTGVVTLLGVVTQASYNLSVRSGSLLFRCVNINNEPNK